MTEQPAYVGQADQAAGADQLAVSAAMPDDLSARAADLEAQLADVRAQAAGADTVRLKVEEPHAGFAIGHITIGTEYTEVPAHAVAAIMDGAASSGVIITQEEV
jgi:hypothetical protein